MFPKFLCHLDEVHPPPNSPHHRYDYFKRLLFFLLLDKSKAKTTAVFYTDLVSQISLRFTADNGKAETLFQ
jgi:hypothetical protein